MFDFIEFFEYFFEEFIYFRKIIKEIKVFRCVRKKIQQNFFVNINMMFIIIVVDL